VVFGRVLSLSGGSCALYVGDELPATRLHEDWVLVHELFHFGVPSFVEGGHWLEEGLATYYEPILRARAGWMTERDLWAHFADQMRRGVPKPGEPPSIEERGDIDSTYWGGALFALLADVALRDQGSSLDDVLRAVRARGGDATHTWRMADVLRVGDEASKTRVLENLYGSFALRGEWPDLSMLLASLGVVAGPGGVQLDDAAPRASVRRAIATGRGP
jgi:predicted metalloprotease with PDZ domain